MKMTCCIHWFLATALTLVAFSSSAQAEEDLDVTMRMVTDDESLTDSVVSEINLKRPILLDAGSRPDNETAQDARERGRAFGQSVAEQAKEAARLRKEGRSKGKPDNAGNSPQ